MIGYGLAFAIGYVALFLTRSLSKVDSRPWTPALLMWGIVAMLLNWVAGKW